MRALLGAEADDLFAALDAPPSPGLRVNSNKLSGEEFIGLSPWRLDEVPWCPSGFLFAQGERPGLHPFHAAGLYYLQDPSAMAVAEALAPAEDELVLDLAAAPGGKSTHICSLMGNRGVLVANDVHGGRARELSRNLERWGARNALVLSVPPGQLAKEWPEHFDAVLLDAPCSGEGMFRKSGEARQQWSDELVGDCSVRQDELLTQAAALVKPGGRLAYSTCTLGPSENERVVAEFLRRQPGWELLPLDLPGTSTGMPDWAEVGKAADGREPQLERAARLWPHRQEADGHFVSVLRKPSAAHERLPAERIREGAISRPDGPMRSDAATSGGRGNGNRGDKERRAALASWQRFVDEHLTHDPVAGRRLELHRDGLYAVPDGAPATGTLRTLRPGLWLGASGRREFEPSHALALALTSSECRRSLDLDPLGEAREYLAGAELPSAGEDGWTLLTVAGHPLGWGRRGRNIVKNRYPKGLRRRNG